LHLPAAAAARRPVKTVRDSRRTALWDKYLEQSSEYHVDLRPLAAVGTPPPRDVRSAWARRQVAFSNGQECLAFGEVIQIDNHTLRAKLCGDPRRAQTLLIRDAVRQANGLLSTAERFGETIVKEQGHEQPISGGYLRTPAEPRYTARVGAVTAVLVNGVY